MSDSGQLVSGMLPPPAPVMSLPRVSESIGLGPPPPQAQQPQAQPATNAPAMWRAPGPLPVHAPTGEMTMGARGPDTVVDAAGLAPAQQAGSSPIPPALQDYVKRTQTLEGSGKDPRSSAVGGFIDGTWLSLMRNHFPQQVAGMSEGQILALRSDAGLRDQAAAAYAADNAKILSAAGQAVTPATMRLSHFLGPKGALAVLTAPPNTPMSKLVSPDAIAANPGTLAGNTAGGVVELVSNQMNAETDHTKLPGLRHVAFGNFNEGAQGVLQGWETRRAEARGRYEQRAAKGEALENLGLAEMARWEQQSEKPPKNMHEAWGQWSGIAGVFALLGGLIGRNGTASIAAAGAMLQAANAADERGYDRAYAEWKDHVDRHAKLAEAFFREGHTIVDDARKSYDDINKELETFSTAWGVREKLDPESFTNKSHQNDLKLQGEQIIKAQHATREENEIQSAAAEKDRVWLGEHPDAKGQVPSAIHNQNLGVAEQERKGTRSSGWVVMTDPTNKDDAGAPVQYRYNPNTAQATTLSGESYQPGGAQKLGGGAQARPGRDEEIEIVGADKKRIAKGLAYTDASGQFRWKGSDKLVKDSVPEGGSVSRLSTAAPRSVQSAYVQKLQEENPSLTATELMKASLEYKHFMSVEGAVGGGVIGRNIIALNTVADHILRVEEYAKALQSKDIPRANQIAQRVSKELGGAEVTTFEVGRDIMADEVVRLLTSTGGTESDRQGMQNRLATMFSPDQFAGVFGVLKDMSGARFKALEQFYAGNDEARRKQFQDNMLTDDSRKVFAAFTSAGGAPGSAAATSPGGGASALPAGIPPGSKPIGVYQGKPVYETPNGRRIQVK